LPTVMEIGASELPASPREFAEFPPRGFSACELLHDKENAKIKTQISVFKVFLCFNK
jgi:hypothetical protein